MKRYIVYFVLFLILFSLLFYFGLPTLAYGFYGLPLSLAFLCGLFVSIEAAFKREKILRIFPIIFGLCLLYIILVPMFTTWAMFHSKQYRNLIGEIQQGQDFSTQVAPISTEKIRIVDESIAYRLGDKVLGSMPSLGSQAFIGDFSIQKVRGQLYWVAPLLHAGFFKWLNNRAGTTGYVMVSATNERDVTLVQEVNGKPIQIKYQPEAFFGDDLARHIYFNGYMTQGFTDFTFEIDDQGKPYWVVTLYKKRIGFSGADATGVVIVNPENGEMKEYDLENAPSWVDRIQPEPFIKEQLTYWGEYVKGYWNFANENKLTITDGISLVYGSDNRAYWYTGLTSVGSDEGTVGFALVDTRTKEAFWYKQVGATEQAARQSAMGKVQEKGYRASFPITYNINGIPTYVMPLKDQAGLIKMIAMVSVEDYTIVGVGNSLKETLRSYKNSVNSKGNALAPSSQSKTFQIQSEVLRISQDIRDGNSFYYLQVKDQENKIFVGSSVISSEIPITQSGDKVLIKYDDGENELVDIIGFDNLQIRLQKTTEQENKEKEFAEK